MTDPRDPKQNPGDSESNSNRNETPKERTARLRATAIHLAGAEARSRAAAQALARRDPKTLDALERVTLEGYYRAGVIGTAAAEIAARADRLPLAARIAAKPGQTVYGKMWETDLGAIERRPFIDRPWLTRATAVIAKFRPKELRKELKASTLTTLALTLARLWYEGKSVCHHSWAYIARRSGLCRDTVRRGLAWFRRHGLQVGSNVLVRPDGATTGPEVRVANFYLPKLPEEGPPELSLPVPDSPAAEAGVRGRLKAEISYVARFCRGAIVTAWGINIQRPSRPDRRAPA
jgi:hypothetical protein